MHFEKYTRLENLISNMNKSIEKTLISYHDTISLNSKGIGTSKSKGNHMSKDIVDDFLLNSTRSEPKLCPELSRRKRENWKFKTLSSESQLNDTLDYSLENHEYSLVRSNLRGDELQESRSISTDFSEPSCSSGLKPQNSDSEKESSWYNALYPTYKSRSQDFKKLFKNIPENERLMVDYSCALQKEVLVHGRLYVSQNYICFHANAFMWEKLVSIKWTDVVSITKEKSGLVLPNAILICTETEKFFLTTFGARDKTYLMLHHIWQSALIGEPLTDEEMEQLLRSCYGEELELSSENNDLVNALPLQNNENFEVLNKEQKSSSALDLIEALKAEINNNSSDLIGNDNERNNINGLSSLPSPICTASHEGRQLCNVNLAVNIDKLFTLLFTTSKFFMDFHACRKTTNLVQSAWVKNIETGEKIREISLTALLTQAVGPKTSQVSETQILLPCSIPGSKYSIDVETFNSGIPYADSFVVESHFCMTYVSEVETNLQIFAEIKFKKHVWAMMKSLITKSCWSGLEEYYESLIKAVAIEIEENKNSDESKKTTIRMRPSSTEKLTDNFVKEEVHDISYIFGKPRQDTLTIMSWILLIAVLFLMIINVLLYCKLWGLEDAAAYTVVDLHVLRNTPKSEEDWINILQQQESLHNIEMRKWQRVLQTAAQLLKQTEESLTELRKSMHPTASEKMFSVLKPNL